MREIRHDTCRSCGGSMWSGVFKSTMVERGDYFEHCRRYIVYNPICAGIVVREIGETVMATIIEGA